MLFVPQVWLNGVAFLADHIVSVEIWNNKAQMNEENMFLCKSINLRIDFYASFNGLLCMYICITLILQ